MDKYYLDFLGFLNCVDDFNSLHGMDSFANNQRGFLYSYITPYFIHFSNRVEVLWTGRFGVRVLRQEAEGFKRIIQQIMDNLDDYLQSKDLENLYELSVQVSEKDSYGEFLTLEVFLTAAYKTIIPSEDAQAIAHTMDLDAIPMKSIKLNANLPQSANFLSKYSTELDSVLGLYVLPEYSNFSFAKMGELH